MKINEVINEGFWSTMLTPKALRDLPDYPARGTGMSNCEARAKARELYGAEIDPNYEEECLDKKVTPSPTKSPPPSTTPDLHPDVSVISSYPLRLKYKNGDFVLDPATNKWMTVSGKNVAPTMSSFLQFQANKL